jgi:hypothetical protein
MANKNELKHPTLENETQMGQIPINDCKEAITSTQKNAGSHALVIGGSIAGLFAARVLADYFETVTILDHDIFPVTPDHRKGVPQSYHAHGLLATAFPILEQLFPGIMNDLRASGAATAFNTVPVAIVTPKGLLPLPKNPGESIAFSRPLLEWHIRRYVSKRSEVHIIVNTEVIGLSVTQDRTRVIGIKMRERGLEGRITTMHADLVVDASGRHSKAPQWLVELGYEAPPVETINSNLRYASRFYAKPEEFPAVLRLLHRYLDLVLFSAIVDPEIAQAYFNVMVLATPPRSLVRPRIVVHVLKVAFKRAVKRLFWGQEDAGFGLSQEALSMLRSRAGKSSKPVSFIERHERKVRFRTRTMMPDKPTE